MATEKFTFQAEVGKLLDIVAHSLYSHKEIFLRELISNASDACDKLRYEALTNPELNPGGEEFKISIAVDKKAKTIAVSDNGVGMSHDDLLETLGTIARSGTQAFINGLSGDNAKDMALIGQFGVGFYSSFMVSEKVEVLTRKAGQSQAWLWVSDGKGEFTIDKAERKSQGATVTLHLAEGEDEYLERTRIETIVKTYSDHIGVPIVFLDEEETATLNTASALWTRQAKDITEDQYKEFYHHTGHAFDEPWMTLHNKVEGKLSYTNLLFIPSSKPFDLFEPERKQHIKLYINRVFITDDCAGLLPSYLRFLRGVIDSEDLSLNVSREMLQKDPALHKINSGLTKKILGELKKKADKDQQSYAAFWDNFGVLLKEGIYEDFENRDKILPIARFLHTAEDGLIGLDSYVENMKEGQKAIYYISGSDAEQAARSPQLEGFKARGVDVLLMTDPVDEFWIPSVTNYKETPFKSATQSHIDLDTVAGVEGPDGKKTDSKDEKAIDVEKLAARIKEALGTQIKDVRPSSRLTDSAVCLVAPEGSMDMHLERLLKQHQKLDQLSPRILEINPGHPMIKTLAGLAESGEKDMQDTAFLLLDQARILEGETVPDPAAFARRLSVVMEKGLEQLS